MTDQEARDELGLLISEYRHGSAVVWAEDARLADAILAWMEERGYRKQPEPEEPATAALAVSARQSGKTRQMIGALLDRANERGIEVKVIAATDDEVRATARVDFAEELTRLGVHTFDIHDIRRRAQSPIHTHDSQTANEGA